MTEQKFTDEDLKQLKESIPMTPDPENQKGNLLALLARLEAAEKALEFMQVTPKSFKPAWVAFQAWLKASGKA